MDPLFYRRAETPRNGDNLGGLLGSKGRITIRHLHHVEVLHQKRKIKFLSRSKIIFETTRASMVGVKMIIASQIVQCHGSAAAKKTWLVSTLSIPLLHKLLKITGFKKIQNSSKGIVPLNRIQKETISLATSVFEARFRSKNIRGSINY